MQQGHLQRGVMPRREAVAHGSLLVLGHRHRHRIAVLPVPLGADALPVQLAIAQLMVRVLTGPLEGGCHRAVDCVGVVQ